MRTKLFLFSLSISFFVQAASLNDLKKSLTPSASLNYDLMENLSKSSDLKERAKLVNFCLRDEADFSEIQNQAIDPFRNYFIENKLDKALRNYPKAQHINSTKMSTKESDGIEVKSWNTKEPLRFLKKRYKNITSFDIESYLVQSAGAERSEKIGRMNKARISARFDLRGISFDNQKITDRGEIFFNVAQLNNLWKIESLEFSKSTSLNLKRESAFSETTQNSSVKNLPMYTRDEAIRRGGYSLSMADVNNDGIIDMLVGSLKETSLLLGDGKGSFKETPNGPLNKETLVKSAVFADFLNRGQQDLILVKFVENKSTVHDKFFSDIVYYKNNGSGHFEKADMFSPRIEKSDKAMPAAVADFNNDGFLDLYVGFPGRRDFTFLRRMSKENSDLQVNAIFENMKKTFDNKASLQLVRTGAGVNYPHSAMAYDYNLDGLMDLFIVDDSGNLSPIFKNNGKVLEENTQSIGAVNFDLGMSVAANDLDADGLPDLVMSNVNFTASERFSNSCLANWGLQQNRIGANGLRIYKGLASDKVAEITQLVNLSSPGEGLAGVEFIDYNNDGLLDIYVTNGLWTGANQGEDLSSLFIRDLYSVDVAPIDKLFDEISAATTTSSFYKTLLTTHNENKKRLSLAGSQKNRLYRNDGNNQYTEVGYLEGVDSIADGYIVATADLNKDGRPELVLRNCDPGTPEVSFPTVQVYLNQYKNNNSVTIKLVGQKSNLDGVGANVIGVVNNKTLQRQLIANNGSAQSEKLLHFGLAEHDQLDSLEISWPSGKKSTLKNVKAGHHIIHEADGLVKN